MIYFFPSGNPFGALESYDVILIVVSYVPRYSNYMTPPLGVFLLILGKRFDGKWGTIFTIQYLLHLKSSTNLKPCSKQLYFYEICEQVKTLVPLSFYKTALMTGT
jgi:hypothetical protein